MYRAVVERIESHSLSSSPGLTREIRDIDIANDCNALNRYSCCRLANYPPAGAVDHDAATPCRGAGPAMPARRDCSVSADVAGQTAICRRNAPTNRAVRLPVRVS